MRVELTWDDREVQEFMKSWQAPAVRRTLGAAASAWGRAVKPVLKAETPVARPGNTYATSAGNLQRLVRSKRIRAAHGIGVVVASMGKAAFYRRFVTGGTKPHVILPKAPGSRNQAKRALAVLGGWANVVHHPGARPNPYVDRARRRGEQVGHEAAERVIFAGLDAQRVTETLDT